MYGKKTKDRHDRNDEQQKNHTTKFQLTAWGENKSEKRAEHLLLFFRVSALISIHSYDSQFFFVPALLLLFFPFTCFHF